ncbi:MAG: hypothetical protein ACRD26_09330 [Vicinamibacterales bacterium]
MTIRSRAIAWRPGFDAALADAAWRRRAVLIDSSAVPRKDTAQRFSERFQDTSRAKKASVWR